MSEEQLASQTQAELQIKCARSKVKHHFKAWAANVRENPGFAFKIPDDLVESLPSELDTYVKSVLENECRLQYDNVYSTWERKQF